MSISEIHTLIETMVNYSPDSSMALLDLAAKKIEGVQNKEQASAYRAENNLRRVDYWLFVDIEKSKMYWEKSYAYYVNHTDNKKMAELYCMQAQIIKIEGQAQVDAVQKAIPYFDKALSYALKQDNAGITAFIYYEKAIALQQAEKWQQSFENTFLAMQYAELSRDSLSMAAAYFLMGRTYYYFGFFDNSETYIAKAIDYGDGMFHIFSVFHWYADILYENHKIDLALQNYQLALEMALEINYLEKAMDIYSVMGQSYLQIGNYIEAEKALIALNELKKTVDYEGPNTLLFSAQMHNHHEEAKLALLDLINFKNKYSSTQSRTLTIDIYKEVADLYFDLGVTSESARFYKKWGTLKDSLQAYTSRLQLSELEKMYFNERSKNQVITKKNEEITSKNEELKESRASQATMGILFIALLLLAGGFTYFIRMKGLKENQKLKVTLKDKQLGQLMEVQETERQRLARELHDGIGQSLAALKLQLQFDDNANASRITVERVDALCKEVRTLSHQMMPLVLRENGLKDAMKQLLKNSFTNLEIEADIVTHDLDIRLPEKIEIHLYRITQELISNILKHANATKVGVQLLLRNDMIILIVEDNGKGFDENDKFEGIGISNLYSRVEALSGTMKIQSSKAEGTCVHIAIPYTHQVTRKTA